MSVGKINNIGGSGGVKLVDINPNKVNTGVMAGYLRLFASTSATHSYIPVNGYSKIALFGQQGATTTFNWVYEDGTESDNISVAGNTWSNYYDISNNVVCVRINCKGNQTYDYATTYYSLLA